MDDFKPLAVFAQVVAAGSMSGAARRLGMSPSAVSQTVRALERQGGVTLLHRSTRKLVLTEAGQRYYPHCQRLLEAAEAAAQSLQLARTAPTGELRLSAPVGFGAHIAPALAPLLAEAPQLRLCLLVDDAMIDLIDARVDIAVRIGRLADSNWVARRLCDLASIVCASPGYVERHGAPRTPQELARHQWLGLWRDTPVAGVHDGFLAPGGAADGPAGAAPAARSARSLQGPAPPPHMPLELQSAAGARERVFVEPRITSNNQVSLQQLCEHGLGLARLAWADARPALLRGALVRVLPEWHCSPMPVWGVTPRREGEAAKVSAALAALQHYFGAPAWAAGPG